MAGLYLVLLVLFYVVPALFGVVELYKYITKNGLLVKELLAFVVYLLVLFIPIINFLAVVIYIITKYADYELVKPEDV